MPITSLILQPVNGQPLRAGKPVSVEGVAWAGASGAPIVKVEVCLCVGARKCVVSDRIHSP